MVSSRLVTAFVVVASLSAVGCLGISPQSDLQVTDVDGDWNDAGDLAFEVTVSNPGGADGTGTLVVDAEVDGGSTYTERREVSLPAGGAETYEVVFEVPDDEFESANGFDFSARVE